MYQRNFPIQQFNSFQLDCTAKEWFSFDSKEMIEQFLKERQLTKEKHFVIGGGNNLLFKNMYYEGLIIQSRIKDIKVIKEDETQVYLSVGSGLKWEHLIEYTLANNWWGLENLSLIPGTVGAAPVQNIGAYGVEAQDCIHEVVAIHKSGDTIRRFSHAECRFGYRDSFFKQEPEWIILEVLFRLSKQAGPILSYSPLKQHFANRSNITIQEISQFVSETRQTKLPDTKRIGNAGSFFKNPVVEQSVFQKIQVNNPDMPFYALEDGRVKIPAGWLIESLNWKNSNNEKVGVYPQQALVIINKNNASGQEVLAFSKEIQYSVKSFYNIDLEREVILID